MRKKILIAVVGIVVLVVLGLVLFVTNLGKIVKVGVEKGGTLILGVPTTLERATVSVREGTVGFDGLMIGSPDGFQQPSMFELDHAHATVDIGSLRSDEIVVHEVVIDGPEVTLEFGNGTTNWGTVMSRLEREPAPEEKAKESRKKIRIDRIVFSNGKVRIAGIPLVSSAAVPLPNLELTDIGTGGGGGSGSVRETIAEVVGKLYKAILAAAGDVVPTEQLQKLGQDLTGMVGETGTRVGEAADEAVTGTAKEAAQKATGALRVIFGGEEDE